MRTIKIVSRNHIFSPLFPKTVRNKKNRINNHEDDCSSIVITNSLKRSLRAYELAFAMSGKETLQLGLQDFTRYY